MNKSWKTTIFGFLGAVGLACTASSNPSVHGFGVVLAAVATFMTGASAQDAK